MVAVSESTPVDFNAAEVVVFAEWEHERLEHEGAGWPATQKDKGWKCYVWDACSGGGRGTVDAVEKLCAVYRAG